jgi:hypothetical protein
MLATMLVALAGLAAAMPTSWRSAIVRPMSSGRGARAAAVAWQYTSCWPGRTTAEYRTSVLVVMGYLSPSPVTRAHRSGCQPVHYRCYGYIARA